ncbi:hypothetical protein, partial [Streptomyces sp. FH025]|uniref:hypothetical protein n=1 Tax=Streptomyces sp. FH025 TaxID=2815937 RepID=UPI001A9E93EE
WESDHDPVTGDFTGTLSATAADGRTVGPWRLVAVPGRPGVYTTRELLPAGHWRITVDCAFPAPGHGERELDVETAVPGDAAPLALGTESAPTPALASTPAAAVGRAARVHETTDATTAWAAIGTAVTAVLLVATGLWLRRRTQC